MEVGVNTTVIILCKKKVMTKPGGQPGTTTPLFHTNVPYLGGRGGASGSSVILGGGNAGATSGPGAGDAVSEEREERWGGGMEATTSPKSGRKGAAG